MQNPKVSVITATYNWSSVLRYAIQSVLWQTLQDFEYLIIGDGCTDDSAQVVASFGDPRLRWHNLEENSGSQSLPNNMALQLARGTYVAYLGHDDLWYPSHLESLVQVLDKTGADLAYAVCEWLGTPGTGMRLITGLNSAENGLIQRKNPPSSAMHRRDVVLHSGLWKDFRTINSQPDLEFLGRVRDYRGQVAWTNRLTVFKFPAALRPNAYRDQRSDQQATYTRRIQAEPEFLETELLAVVAACIANNASLPKLKAPQDAPPGWLVNQFRQIKGLEAKAPLPRSSQKQSFLSRVFSPFRPFSRRILRKLLRMVDEA